MNFNVWKLFKILAAIFALLAVALVLFVVNFLNSLRSVYEVESPTKIGSLIAYREHGFDGAFETILVRDYSISEMPIDSGISNIEDMGGLTKAASWSRDGTLLVLGRRVWQHNDGQISNPRMEWTQGYDFNAHAAIPAKLSARSISALLQKRGGATKSLDLDITKFRTPWWWESYK